MEIHFFFKKQILKESDWKNKVKYLRFLIPFFSY